MMAGMNSTVGLLRFASQPSTRMFLPGLVHQMACSREIWINQQEVKFGVGIFDPTLETRCRFTGLARFALN